MNEVLLILLVYAIWCIIGFFCLVDDFIKDGLDVTVENMFFFILLSFIGPIVGVKNILFKITKIDTKKILIKSNKTIDNQQ